MKRFVSGFSPNMAFIALTIGLIFLVVIIVYPLIFSPQNLSRSTAPAPMTPAKSSMRLF